jgi:ABC-type transporter Mla subunit MlaD
VELEELRQRLLLRSKSADIPPIAHPVQISEVALSQAASKLHWETAISPAEIAARLGINGTKAENSSVKSLNGGANRAESAPVIAKDSGQEAVGAPAQDLAPSEGKRAETAPAATPAEPISILTTTVDQLSEPTEAFREHLTQLGKQLEPIDAAVQSAELALKRVAGLHEHLSSLASNFQSVKAFAEQVKTLSAAFEPMKGLTAQLDQVVAALYANVKEIGVALAPVKSFQSRVRQLATALDSIDKLEGQISGLAETFRPASAPSQGTPQPAKSAPVAQAA